jgi:hypothetical protein
VNGLRRRAAAFFVTPARASERLTAAVPAETRAVVLGALKDAPPLAAAVALTLRAGERAPSGLVATWHAGGDDRISRGVATRSASRLAARLAGRDLPAAARGRLAWLQLPAEPVAAAAALRRAQAAVHGPVVTALAGARPAAHGAGRGRARGACRAVRLGRRVPAAAARPVPRVGRRRPRRAAPRSAAARRPNKMTVRESAPRGLPPRHAVTAAGQAVTGGDFRMWRTSSAAVRPPSAIELPATSRVSIEPEASPVPSRA